MNFFKVIGGIGAGLLAGAGLIVAGRTGLGKPDEKADDEKAPAEAEAPVAEAAEEKEETEASEEEV